MKSTNQLTSNPEIFIDLDGVLVNLFGYVANFYKVKSYKDITDKQWETFFTEQNAEELFANLLPFPTTNKLIEMVVNMFSSYNILSSPLSFDKNGSIRGKTKWLRKHIKIPFKHAIFDHEKYKFALQPNGTPNILIDDFKKNVNEWNEAGGYAIKFQSDENSLEHLKVKLTDILSKYQ